MNFADKFVNGLIKILFGEEKEMNEIVEDGKKLLDELKKELEQGKPLALYCLILDEDGPTAHDFVTDGILPQLVLGQMDLWKNIICADSEFELNEVIKYDTEKK